MNMREENSDLNNEINEFSPETQIDFDSIDPDTGEEMNAAGTGNARIAKLRQQLKEAQEKRDEYLDGWQRTKADMVNARKDAATSIERMTSRAKESIIEDIIPVLDSFDMAAGSEAWGNVDESWRSGIDQIRNQLLDVFSRYGVERFGKVGEHFDHSIHEAVQEMEDAPGESGTIAKLLRYGYRMNGRVIRPAQVILKK